MYQKSGSYDAEAVALVLINMLDKLPDAIPDDKYWTLSQLVNRRDNICSHQQRLKNQLHEQLCVAYPSYKQFFGDISRRTALYFWLRYPSPEHLLGKTAEELAVELRPVSHNIYSFYFRPMNITQTKPHIPPLPKTPQLHTLPKHKTTTKKLPFAKYKNMV